MQLSAQYSWSNPQPSGYINTKVIFTDPATGYIMNYNGDLLKTQDAGTNWNIYRNFPYCVALDARDSFLLIGGGDTTVYITTDKAKTWKTGFIKQKQVIQKFQIITKDTVFAVSKNSSLSTTELYRSVDRGMSWQLINGSFVIKGIDFINSKLGYATSYQGVYKTEDGGVSWQLIFAIPPTTAILTTIKFFDKNNGYVYQEFESRVLKTSDGGATWTVCLGGLSSDVYTMFFANASTIYFGCENGLIYRSTDSGNSWQLKFDHPTDGYGIYSIHFVTATTGYFVGERGQILKTTDGGDSFHDYSPTYVDIKPLSFPTPSVGYAASWTNLFKTVDTGKTWTVLPFSLANPLYNRFQFMSFFSKDTGIAISQTPLQVFKTYDGGQNWKPITLPILYRDEINGFFAIGNTIYINTSGGGLYNMLKSKDRGENWTVLSANALQVKSLFFTDEKTGYGASGPFIYKTTDSAKTWSTVFVNDSKFIYSIWFTSPAIGYAVGDDGYNQLTIDSGKTWTRFKIAPDNFNFNEVYAIKFFTPKVGYLTSQSGGIYKTSDGGKLWRAEKQSPSTCRFIEISSDTTVYFGGDFGTILKKDIREYFIDSMKVIIDTACSVKATARITAVLSTVDSIWFEYGTTRFLKTILASPSSVKDSMIKCELKLLGLSGDSSYTFRVKIFYRNAYYFSDPFTFKSSGVLPKPVISASGGILTSSATSGNQWYLNNVLIPGAVSTTFQPSSSGNYTVQQMFNSCVSPMSNAFNFVTTGVNDPVLVRSISIYPNPVSSTVWIKNKDGRKLNILIVDSWGRILTTMQTRQSDNEINLRAVSSGVYTILIEDVTSRKTLRVKLVKL